MAYANTPNRRVIAGVIAAVMLTLVLGLLMAAQTGDVGESFVPSRLYPVPVQVVNS